jgi:UDP-N-acetylglucosamine 4,6-dehydratase (inverting)
MFKNKSILITGGTGSLGQSLVEYLLKKHNDIKKIIIFSRDELKQYEMAMKFNVKKNRNLRFFLGDVRDKNRLILALNKVDYVVHAAALKQIDTAEYNPFESIKTNIIGSQNLIEACLEKKVSNVIGISTDKATSPLNLYGATKLCFEKLFVSANNYSGEDRKPKFSVVRYGNVVNSRGSVIPMFLNQDRSNKNFTITDSKMTRFTIMMNDAVKLVLYALVKNLGGEILIPKLESYNIVTLMRSINLKRKFILIGKRPGEKLNEDLMSYHESENSLESKKYYILLPANKKIYEFKKYQKKHKAKKIKKPFIYSSENAPKLSISELKKIIFSS